MTYDRVQPEQYLAHGQRLNFVLTFPESSAASDSTPVVVLLGWVGCAQRVLSKFSDTVNSAGYPTIRAVCPTAAIFSPSRRPRKRWAQALLEYIWAVEPSQQRPLVFWAFSNGGAFPLGIINRLAASDERFRCFQERTLGVIFDSAPCYMHGTTGARALGEGRPAVARALLAALFFLIMLCMLVLDPFAPQRFWQEMTRLRLGRKCLYLYSADDHLCDADKLESLIAARRGAGHDVSAHKWETSKHVAHLRLHPQLYTQLVLNFLREVQS